MDPELVDPELVDPEAGLSDDFVSAAVVEPLSEPLSDAADEFDEPPAELFCESRLSLR